MAWLVVVALGGCSRSGFLTATVPPGDFVPRTIVRGEPTPKPDDAAAGDRNAGDSIGGDVGNGDTGGGDGLGTDSNAGGGDNFLCLGVVCGASDQCHDPGVCDPLTGMCSDPPKANTSPCDDDVACTNRDECHSGNCLGFIDPVPGIVYVDPSRPPGGGGTSWCDASYRLSLALAIAVPGDEIWVAAGRYNPGAPRPSTFNLRNGIEIYGGFAVGETARSQRNIKTNVTILDGDVNLDDVGMMNRTDNNYHVVTADAVGATARLDGFTIANGHADGPGTDDTGGGILINNDASPSFFNIEVVRNHASTVGGGVGALGTSTVACVACLFSGNWSGLDGGAIWGSDMSIRQGTFLGNSGAFGGAIAASGVAVLVDTSFVNNQASVGGGAVYSADVLAIVNSSFFTNTSMSGGGAVYAAGTGFQLTNSWFAGNIATGSGGAVNAVGAGTSTIDLCSFGDNSAPSGALVYAVNTPVGIRNSILWGAATVPEVVDAGTAATVISDSIVRNGWAGAGARISTLDPLFADPLGMDLTVGTPDDDLTLQAGSPALDACNEGLLPPDTVDLDGDFDFAEPVPLDGLRLPRKIDQPAADTGIGTPPLCDLGAFERQ